jgi:hypothetical protein
MGNGHAQLHAHKSTSGRRIHVTYDDDPVGSLLKTNLLVGDQYTGGLFGMRPTAYVQVIIGFR